MSTTNLMQLIGGERKFARKQAYRERKTRSGLRRNGRQVVDDFSDDIAIKTESTCESEFMKERSRRCEIIRKQIEESAKKETYCELVTRVLFRGESSSSVAKELGLKTGSGRCIVSRSREYLGLAKKSDVGARIQSRQRRT